MYYLVLPSIDIYFAITEYIFSIQLSTRVIYLLYYNSLIYTKYRFSFLFLYLDEVQVFNVQLKIKHLVFNTLTATCIIYETRELALYMGTFFVWT